MGNYIKEIVRKYTIKYDTRNPFKLAECLGIEVQLGTPGCDGCYMFLKNHRYIFLDQNLDELDLLQVMAHELGHALLLCHPTAVGCREPAIMQTNSSNCETGFVTRHDKNNLIAKWGA